MHFWRGTGYATPGIYRSPENFSAILPKSIAPRSPTWPRPAADTSSSTKWRSPCCAIPRYGRVTADGNDPARLIALYVDALGAAIAVAPSGMAVGVHMCRGNFKGKYLAEGGYDEIAKALFAVPGVTHFLLEFDTARAGDFAPLRLVAADKGVVLGLVSSKTAALENADDLLRRIDEAARYIDKDRLAISPQCGFASTVAGNPLSEADERAKLALCVQTARAAWPL